MYLYLLLTYFMIVKTISVNFALLILFFLYFHISISLYVHLRKYVPKIIYLNSRSLVCSCE